MATLLVKYINTARLFGKLDPRLNQKPDEFDYLIAQLLCGCGGFQLCLHKIDKALFPDCVFCKGMVDAADHTFLWNVGSTLLESFKEVVAGIQYLVR